MEATEAQGQTAPAEASTPAPASTASILTPSQSETPAASAAPAEATAPPADIYTPSFKFKVKDKELDFDEYIKPVIKDKETESKVKDLYEKAYGLDEVKADRQGLKERVKEWEGKYNGVESSLKTLGAFVQKKDFRSFFDILSIPKQDIINYALEELKYQELPPEQRAMIDSQRQREYEYQAQLSQNQSLQTQMQQIVLQQTTSELDQAFANPEVTSVANAYDTRLGKPGALRGEVIRRGQYYEAVHKTSPPASQLVQEVLSLIGANQFSSQGQTGAPGTLVPQSQTVQSQKPVIPSFSSGGVSKSPVKKVPTSIDDLKKIRQQQQQTS